MSVKICVSYSDEKECAEIISRLNVPGINVSKPYCNGQYKRRYITFKSSRRTVDKAEQFRYNGIEQTFAVDDIERQYPIK